MARALQLAERGLFSAHPNPRVGCVLVKDDVCVGEGWHRRTGEPHAEIIALRSAGERARGAVCYVTLEPCCHHGRTGPCTQNLIEAGVRRVCVAMPDPNPLVAGKGLAVLKKAGIAVETGLLAEPALRLNRGFVSRMTRVRPFVLCKIAASLDGRTALANGQSKWITSDAARRDVQTLRARSSAVMTGISTVLADDPSLTVRAPELDMAGRQPMRVILDSNLRISSRARMLDLPGETIVLTTRDPGSHARPLADRGVKIIQLPGSDAGVDLGAALETLAKLEINEVLLEAGATLSGAMLDAGLVDEIVLYMAPKFLGDGARSLCRLPDITDLNLSQRFDITDVRMVGPDLRITATCSPPLMHPIDS